MSKVLLVDDDSEVLSINRAYLEGEGFDVIIVSDSSKVINLVKKENPDCVVLDVMMPGKDGFEVCLLIREFSNVPVIFLSGRSDEESRIKGLTLGAMDYVVKPYSLKELALKIRIMISMYTSSKKTKKPASSGEILRSTDIKQSSIVLEFGKLRIDQLAHKVYFDGCELGISGREYEVLIYMAKKPNSEITFEDLEVALFGSYQNTARRSIMVIVSRLRKQLMEYPELENLIETIYSKGYRFVPRYTTL